MCAVLATMMMASCSGKTNLRPGDTNQAMTSDSYHADNDIAMTVSSLVDAIRVGEPLDTTGYNYDGVLTDGQGRPIYTNLHGQPGRWDVDVLSENSVSIRNTDLGDLLPEDLEGYVVSELGLTEDNVVDSLTRSVDGGSQTVVYDFGGGLLRFETHTTLTPGGAEAPLMLISAMGYNQAPEQGATIKK